MCHETIGINRISENNKYQGQEGLGNSVLSSPLGDSHIVLAFYRLVEFHILHENVTVQE